MTKNRIKATEKAKRNSRKRQKVLTTLTEKENRILTEQQNVIDREEKRLSMLRACFNHTWRNLVAKYSLPEEVEWNRETGKIYERKP